MWWRVSGKHRRTHIGGMWKLSSPWNPSLKEGRRRTVCLPGVNRKMKDAYYKPFLLTRALSRWLLCGMQWDEVLKPRGDQGHNLLRSAVSPKQNIDCTFNATRAPLPRSQNSGIFRTLGTFFWPKTKNWHSWIANPFELNLKKIYISRPYATVDLCVRESTRD